jgi:transcriptional regulator
MYMPPHFVEERPDIIADFIARHGFATLVTTGDAGLMASHLPLLYEPDAGGHGRLLGHLARNNPQVRDLAGGREALAIFQGPHAYVSPTWYATQPSVPTWNYAVVHAYGTAEAITDPAAMNDLLDRLTRTYEAGREPAWRLAEQPERYIAGMQRGIGAFAIAVTRLEAKFKLSQNRNEEDRRRVVAALDAADPASADVARLMRERGV